MNNGLSLQLSATVDSVLERSGRWFAVIIRQLLHLLLLALLAIGSYYVVSHYLVQSVQVVGVSMMPTLHPADRYILNRWVYYLHPPQRNDIVVLKDPTDGVIAVKRIIATPGESVYFKNGDVYVNGKKLREPYLTSGTPTFMASAREALVLCGKDQYFVLGDNRNDSVDSRMYGPVRRGNILGAVLR